MAVTKHTKACVHPHMSDRTSKHHTYRTSPIDILQMLLLLSLPPCCPVSQRPRLAHVSLVPHRAHLTTAIQFKTPSKNVQPKNCSLQKVSFIELVVSVLTCSTMLTTTKALRRKSLPCSSPVRPAKSPNLICRTSCLSFSAEKLNVAGF